MARPRTTRAHRVLAAAIAGLAIATAVVWTVVALPRRARELAIAGASALFQRDVSIGRVSGDPWRGVVLEDVSVDAAEWEPRHAVLTARRVTLHFDPLALARGVWTRRGGAVSISQVMFEDPVFQIARDRAGVWNTSALFPRLPASGAGAPFLGRLVILGGRITFADHHRVAPAVFSAVFEDVNGAADFAQYPLVSVRASFVEHRDSRRVAGRLSGTYVASSRALDLDVDASGADAGAWGPYLVTTPALRILGGALDVRMRLLRSVAGAQETIDYSGRLAIRDGHAAVPARGGVITGVHGEVIVTNLSVSTAGLRAALNGSPVEVRGEVSFYGAPRLDLAVRTSGVDLQTIRQLFFPESRLRVEGAAAGQVRIVGALSSPRLVGRIDDARGRLERQPFDHASMDFALYGDMLHVAGARGEAAGGRVSANAWWTIGRPAFLLAMRLDGADAAALSRWAPSALQSLDGRLTATVMARQQGSTLTAAGSADLARPVILGTALDAAAAAFRVDERGVTVDRAYVRQGPAWALANGHIAPQGTLTLSAYGGAIDLTRLSDLGLRLDLAGHSDFAGRISGPWNAPELAGTLQVSKGRILGVAFDAARSTLALRRGRLAVSSLVARAGRARYRAAGTVEWQSPARLGLDIEAERASAATLTHLARLPFSVSGVVDGRLRVDGPASQPSVAGVMTLRDAIVSGQKVEEAAATFRWDGIRFSLERASVRRGRSVIDVAGTIDRRTGFALDVASQALDLRDLTLPPLGATLDGRIALTGRITGQPSAPTIALSARSSDLLVNGIRFEHTEGRVEWTPRTVRLDPVLLRHGDERYQITGEVGLNGPPSVRLTADVTDGRLSTLLGLANARLGVPLDGTVSGLATIEGPVANPAARLDIRMTRGRFGDHPLVEGHADLTLRDGAVTIEEFQVRPLRGVIAAQGRLNLRGESQVEVGGTDLDLDILRPLLRLRRPLVGQLNFTTQLGGTLASPEIGFALELVRAGLEGATFDSLVANAFYRDGLLQVQQALLTQNGHKLRASGSLPFNPALLRFDPQRPVDFRLGLSDVNLSLLRLITDRVEDAVGAVEGEVRITGSITAPHTSGGVQVRDGRVRIRGLQTPLESLRLDLRFEENAIRVAEGSARVGGGLARLQGGARVVQMAGPSLALVIAEDAPLVLQGTEMRIVVRPYVDARFDGTARLRGTLGDPRRPLTVDGRVMASQGLVTVGPAEAGEPSQIPLAFGGVRFDVGEAMAVQVGGLRFDLRPGDSLTLTGSLRTPMLDGTVAAQEGKIRALGTIFDLREGTATFLTHQGLRPAVVAQAETEVGSTRILLTVRGIAPDGLTRELRSDPPKSEAEIMALLGGQVGLTRLLAGDVQGALTVEISRRLFGTAGQAIERALGLNELTITYDFEQPLALRAGKRLVRDLYVAVETTFGVQARWLAALEYRFARDWQLTLRVDSDRRSAAVFWYTTRF